MITWILWTIVVYLIGHRAGYVHAHIIVAKECERLGKFFVGTKVYTCSDITDTAQKKEENG
jgi:hypothetical protein